MTDLKKKIFFQLNQTISLNQGIEREKSEIIKKLEQEKSDAYCTAFFLDFVGKGLMDKGATDFPHWFKQIGDNEISFPCDNVFRQISRSSSGGQSYTNIKNVLERTCPGITVDLGTMEISIKLQNQESG